MKKPHIQLIQYGKGLFGFDLGRLGPILELMNFDVELDQSKERGKLQFLGEGGGPDLIILDRPPLPASSKSKRGGEEPLPTLCPKLILSEETTLLEVPSSGRACPIDVMALHDLISRSLNVYPRRNLRVPAHLPCLFSLDGSTYSAEILSLGVGGAFIKTACQKVREGEPVDVWIPLLGMKVELEIRSRVLYLIAPKQENNYLQGIGIGFISPSADIIGKLDLFLRHSLLNDIYPVFPGFGVPDPRTALPAPPPDSRHGAPSRTQLGG